MSKYYKLQTPVRSFQQVLQGTDMIGGSNLSRTTNIICTHNTVQSLEIQTVYFYEQPIYSMKYLVSQ